jgi:hypothetical protein
MRIEEIRTRLANRLRERRGEIEQAALTRIHSVADSREGTDPEYLDGLRAAVSAALEYWIEAVERSEDRPPPMPTVLLSQARLAVRHGVKLEIVLRRYLAGYTLLGDFLIEESERVRPLNGASLKRLLRAQATLLDRLIDAVSEEYAREARAGPGSTEKRQARRIEELLEGRRLDTSELSYDFGVVHLGAVATGAGGAEALRGLATALDRRLMLVSRGERIVWAWLGGRHPFDPDDLDRIVSEGLPAPVSLALGEPAEGMEGWRLTNQQARAAMPIALRGPDPVVRYAEVALLASICQDDLLATSLHRLYLAPLEGQREGGAPLRETLRAYFAAERNISSTAAALGVNRKTVVNRLRAIEAMIGRSLSTCAADVEAALRIADLGHPVLPRASAPSARASR